MLGFIYNDDTLENNSEATSQTDEPLTDRGAEPTAAARRWGARSGTGSRVPGAT